MEVLAHRPLSDSDAAFLRNSQCGFVGKDPKVCCPFQTVSSTTPYNPYGQTNTDRFDNNQQSGNSGNTGNSGDSGKLLLRRELTLTCKAIYLIFCEWNNNSWCVHISASIYSPLLPTLRVCGLGVEDRIVGGIVTDIDEFPWMALIQYQKRKWSFRKYATWYSSLHRKVPRLQVKQLREPQAKHRVALPHFLYIFSSRLRILLWRCFDQW